jgi:hypothetical protein
MSANYSIKSKLSKKGPNFQLRSNDRVVALFYFKWEAEEVRDLLNEQIDLAIEAEELIESEEYLNEL